ncbi:enoyl-CoA hydratase-related protein [Erythrobacter sp. Alg231-14]|uniref:enoyl-CoA hydratase-related protein n=1 Tax=Erythrobacter sp. Alg231-14 TaxID=1922225 RepID=UPI000D55288F
MSDPVLYSRDDAVATVTLNRDDTRNSLSDEVIAALLDAMAMAEADKSVSCVILTGAGKAFSSGGNLRDIGAMTAEKAMSPLDIEAWYKTGIQRIPLLMEQLTVPVIAAVNGPAIGAGNDLATMCDMRIASTKARFAESFLKVGIIPGDGGAWFLPRIVGYARAAEMLYTSEAINAEKALDWGLVSQVVEPDDLMDAARALAAKVVSNPPFALRKGKEIMLAAQRMGLEDSLAKAATTQGVLQQMEDHQEAVNAILEKRKPSFTGR